MNSSLLINPVDSTRRIYAETWARVLVEELKAVPERERTYHVAARLETILTNYQKHLEHMANAYFTIANDFLNLKLPEPFPLNPVVDEIAETRRHRGAIDPTDDPRSNGYCSKHGDYNGRELSCPQCADLIAETRKGFENGV